MNLRRILQVYRLPVVAISSFRLKLDQVSVSIWSNVAARTLFAGAGDEWQSVRHTKAGYVVPPFRHCERSICSEA